MALDFGLLSSQLFPSSDALGDGMSANQNAQILRDSGGAFRELMQVTLGADAATIDLTQIPTGFKYLKIIGTGDFSLNGENWGLQFNGDTGTNYNNESATALNNAAIGKTSSINIQRTFELTISNRASIAKSISGYEGGHVTATALIGGGWSNTSDEINAIKMVMSAGNYLAGFRITLYGAP